MVRYTYWDRNGVERVGWRLSEEEMRRRAEEWRNRKETPDEMVRALQNIFCCGRYRSYYIFSGSHSQKN